MVLMGLACLLVLGANPPLVSDDFESPTVGNRWTFVTPPPAGSAFRTDAEAAHRGGRGLRLEDNDGSAGAGTTAALNLRIAPVPALFLREWVRVVSTNGLGNVGLSQLLTNSPVNAIVDVYLAGDGTSFVFQGPNRDGTYRAALPRSGMRVGQWHLLEWAAVGAGTASGRRELWVDGTLLAEHTEVDWTGIALDHFSVGEPWSTDRRFQGVLDLDDIRAGESPHASTLRLELAAGAPTSDGCAVLALTLVDSRLEARDAPYDFEVALESQPAGSALFYADAQCTQPLTTVSMAAGAQTVYASRPSEQAAEVRAHHVDFLALPLSLSGTTARRQRSLYDLGCSAAGGGAQAWALLACLSVLRRSARRRLALQPPGRRQVRLQR